jgi:hypothetical protein
MWAESLPPTQRPAKLSRRISHINHLINGDYHLVNHEKAEPKFTPQTSNFLSGYARDAAPVRASGLSPNFVTLQSFVNARKGWVAGLVYDRI